MAKRVAHTSILQNLKDRDGDKKEKRRWSLLKKRGVKLQEWKVIRRKARDLRRIRGKCEKSNKAEGEMKTEMTAGEGKGSSLNEWEGTFWRPYFTGPALKNIFLWTTLCTAADKTSSHHMWCWESLEFKLTAGDQLTGFMWRIWHIGTLKLEYLLYLNYWS